MLNVKKDKEQIRPIFEEACARRESLIFVTPYLRFESSFVHLSGNEVHISVSMGKGGAVYALRTSDLKMRFPHRFSVLEAPAKIIGYGIYEGTKTLKLELPSLLYENDDRKAYRVGNVGSITTTFSTPGGRIIEAALMDISATGAKLRTREPLQSSVLKSNDTIMLTIPVPDAVTINTGGIIRYMENNVFGLEYTPRLAASVLDPLSSWIFMKQEEERERMARSMDLGKGSNGTNTQTINGGEGSNEIGLLLITRDDEMEADLNKLLAEDRQFYRVQPTINAIKTTLVKNPHLVIIHIMGNSIEERRRIPSLVEAIPKELPVLLLGTDIRTHLLFEMAQDCKVASSMVWMKERSTLLQRLVLGMLRKHYNLGESPIV